ncbi:MAG: hypothetical protein QNK11_08325 [Legionella sp.]|nr:hypothetical protein [Legionella sp.]
MNLIDFKFEIPAKTFLLGEYVALQGGPAIILTTTPCFEIGLTKKTNLSIHPDSPAGRFWQALNMKQQLRFYDPYGGIGGLGASSAEFLGAYLASLSIQHQSLTESALLEAYWTFSLKANQGMRPSGYDVLAQAQSGCVYLNRNQSDNKQYAWCFEDIAFVLLHTGQKLPTHEHLQNLYLTEAANLLSPIVDLGKKAFDTSNSALLIEAVNAYAKQLLALDLVAKHTQAQINQLSQNPDVLAVKGCGALGADVLFTLVPKTRLIESMARFSVDGFRVLASSDNLYTQKNQMECI